MFASLTILGAIFLTTSLLLGLAGRAYLKRAMIDSNASLIGAVIGKYPETEPEILKQIRSVDRETALKGRALLSRYGIHGGETLSDSPAIRNSLYFNLAASVISAVFFSGILLLLLGRYFKTHYTQIHDLTVYAGRISTGDYSLDIRDNKEGDLSVLKNEVFKITTTLREQAAALQKEKVLLADSLADISHQLKTPLTSLLVLNDLLIDNPAEEDRAVFLDRMGAQLARIEWLITSLLKISRLDAGKVNLKQEKILAGNLVEKVLESLSIPLEIKELQVEIEGDPAAGFRGDFNWSAEALINIAKNCIEHTPEQGRLDISYHENPIYTEIRIADSGEGIAPEDLPHIFTRFYKGRNAPEDQVGIGLAMARAIVEKQGGEITVKSPPGAGAQFSIKFYKTGAGLK